MNRTKDDIRNAPEYHEFADGDDVHRRSFGAYYGYGGSGYRDRDDVV